METPTLQALARQALEVLEAQQEYFHDRDPARLRECKRQEKALRDTCRAILEGKTEPVLF